MQQSRGCLRAGGPAAQQSRERAKALFIVSTVFLFSLRALTGTKKTVPEKTNAKERLPARAPVSARFIVLL